MNVQTLDIISVNIWQILLSLVNLLIIFRIMKKFLFKPVQKIMAARQEQVDRIYSDANQSRDQADLMKREYEQKLENAREEADGLVKNAVQTAQRRSDQLLAEANAQASRTRQKAEEEIEQQKKKMLQDVRGEISDLAVDIASKVMEREINASDYDGFVDDFIRNVGERD